jgi:hypothetical protein
MQNWLYRADMSLGIEIIQERKDDCSNSVAENQFSEIRRFDDADVLSPSSVQWDVVNALGSNAETRVVWTICGFHCPENTRRTFDENPTSVSVDFDSITLLDDAS